MTTLKLLDEFAERPPISARRSTPRIAVGSPALQVVLTTSALAIGLCLLVGLYSASARPAPLDRIVVCGLLVLPAVGLAASRSTLLLDYLLLIVVTNRELRRLLDWGQGQYDATSLLSLLPLLTTALMALVVTEKWKQLPRELRLAGGCLIGSMAYGTALGLVGYGFASLYASAEWVTPLIVLYYCVALRPSAAIVRRWTIVLGTLGVLVGAYGIYQWTDPPPWDAAWVVWSGMTSSMGPPVPYQFSICSTLESRGPAAMFFAITSASLVALPVLRRGGGVLLAAVPATALLLTQARTGLIYVVISLLAAAAFARRGGLKIVLAVLVAGGLTVLVLGQQAQSNIIFNRVNTLGDLQDDDSANGRVGIASQGSLLVLTKPQGFGFGSGGNATKVAVNSGEQDAVGDNGYLEILSTLGLPGTLLYATGLGMIVRLAMRNRRLPAATEPVTQLGLGMLVALVPTMMVANQLISAHASYVWIFLSRHLAYRPDHPKSTRDRPPGS